MPMYYLLEYSQNYSITSGSLWNYYRDEIDDVDYNASDGKSFKYKTKIVGKTCLLDYEYIKNHYRLIAFDPSRQTELDTDPQAIQQIKFLGQLKKTK